jgi:phosphotransferase system  glucose/maltose/N-acetylglucosamine-specific IIC component
MSFIKTYISISYLLAVPSERWLLLLVGLTSIVAIIFGATVKLLNLYKFKEKVYKKILGFLFSWSWIFGFIGLLLSFFAYQNALYFGYRIWLFFWIIGFFVGVIYFFLRILPVFKKDLELFKDKKEKEKWLKKRKK